MKINISEQMAQAVIAALREHIEINGTQDFGPEYDYQVSNEEALEFFEAMCPLHGCLKCGTIGEHYCPADIARD